MGLSSIVYLAWCWVKSAETIVFQKMTNINSDQQPVIIYYDRHNSKHSVLFDPHTKLWGIIIIPIL